MGMTTTTAVAILAFSTSLVLGQSFTCTCDGLQAPDWDACDTIRSVLDEPPIDYTTSSNPQEPCTYLSPPDGIDPDSLNCVILYCPRDGVSGGEIVHSSDIKLGYALLTSNCKAETGMPGGTCEPNEPPTTQNKVQVQARANKSYPARRSIGQSSAGVNNTRGYAHPPSTEKNKRQHARAVARDVSKRQTPPDSDTSFQLFVTSNNVENPDARIKVFGPSPSGSTYTVMKSHSETHSVSSSASLGADFFEIFTASVSVDVGFSDTIEESTGYTLPVNCPDGMRGVVYWTPLFTRYEGLYQPSGTQVEWYVENGGDQTSYDLQCLEG